MIVLSDALVNYISCNLCIMPFTFRKNQKLKSNRDIAELFVSGKSIYFPPLKVNYKIFPSKSEPFMLAGFSVSKKFFKSAVKRNLLKRRMREAYRLNKQALEAKLSVSEQKVHLMFIYQGDKICALKEIENAVNKLFGTLVDI